MNSYSMLRRKSQEIKIVIKWPQIKVSTSNAIEVSLENLSVDRGIDSTRLGVSSVHIRNLF